MAKPPIFVPPVPTPQTAPQTSQPKTKRFCILDTDTFQHQEIEGLREGIISDLNLATSSGFELAISDITYFEIIDGASVEKEKRRLKALEGITHFYVSTQVLAAAGHIGCLYKEEGHEVSDFGDKIIAATAVISNSIIYTFNGNDYPRPFFNELTGGKRIHKYERKRKRGPNFITSYFLEPDTKLVSDRHQTREDKYKDIQNREFKRELNQFMKKYGIKNKP